MTEQYTQGNINRGGTRRVDQRDIDTTLAVPAVVLNADDALILCADFDAAAYQVNLPRASEMLGKTVMLKNVTGGAVVTVAPAQNEADTAAVDTIDGAAGALAPDLAATFSAILFASPPLAPVAPADIGLQSFDWSVVKAPAAP